MTEKNKIHDEGGGGGDDFAKWCEKKKIGAGGSNGKGDADRRSNINVYRDNYDSIFRKNKKPKKKYSIKPKSSGR